MEPERKRSGSTLKKGRKRRLIPSKVVGAAEATRSHWDLEEKQQPIAKVSNGGIPTGQPEAVWNSQIITQYHLPWGWYGRFKTGIVPGTRQECSTNILKSSVCRNCSRFCKYTSA